MKTAVLASVLYLAACGSALKEPSPVATYAPGRAHGRTPSELVAQANGAWARRAEPGQAQAAQGLYLDAAAADPHRIDALLGAMRAVSYRIENEKDAPRDKLSQTAVELGQWCQRRAPKNAECDYRLAIALGQYAREHTSSGRDAAHRMVDLLHAAIRVEPSLDSAGPHRVLALLLLRAPGWPLGPGDSEEGLREAQAAVRLAPDAASNQLVLGEALAKNGHGQEARGAYAKAAELAAAAEKSREPEAPRWLAEARAGIAKNGG